MKDIDSIDLIHEEFSKFFRAEYLDYESYNKGGPLALLRGIQQRFIDIQNRCVLATDELSRLVIETAGQLPATPKDFRTQELVLDIQTRLWELSKFQPIGTHQEDIAKKFYRFQIREERTKLNSATQNAIGFVLSLLLDTTPGDDVPKLNIKKVFATCREKYCSINGALIGRTIDECMRKESSMLAKAETKARCHLAITMVVRINPRV
jgi:hypothetical protein